ncbi:hypothetical protein [Streptomyces sp. NPDC001083]|uniref:hypothetical protein n=1 Tax=Streptomyces sp. NPDC001083 TaxID=3364545 RepID=UPI0036992467
MPNIPATGRPWSVTPATGTPRPGGPPTPASWLTPAITLTRWWQAWTDTDPPHELHALIDAVTTGQGIDLYLRI